MPVSEPVFIMINYFKEKIKGKPFFTALRAISCLLIILPVMSIRAESGMLTAILDPSPENVEGLPSDPAMHWERHLRGMGENAEIIRTARERSFEKFNRLIIPGPMSLNRAETEAIINFIRGGGSLILCKSAGESLSGDTGRSLAESLGLRYEKLPQNIEGVWRIVLQTPDFLLAGIPRIKLLGADADGARMIKTKNNKGFWTTSGGGEVLDQWEGNGAIITGELGRGRFVWLGFGLENVGGDLENSESFLILTENIFRWLDRIPVLEKNPWPGHYTSAATFSMDTETSFINIRNVLETEVLPAYTLFILTDPAQPFRSIVDEAGQRKADGRRLVEMAIHGDSHDVFRGQPPEKQLERLQGTRRILREITGIEVVGFRPPEELYDHYTLEALIEAGYKYIFSDNRADRAEPRSIQLPRGRLVQFPMLNQDDIKLIMLPGRTDTDEILSSYIADMNMILNREGIYMANFHTHVLATDANIPVLDKAVRHAMDKRAWIPSCREAAEWWLARESIDASITDLSPGKAEITVENRGRERVDNLSLSFWMPRAYKNPVIRLSSAGSRQVNVLQQDNRLRFIIFGLNPAEKAVYTITWQE